MNVNTPKVSYFSGLDLGQSQEVTALAVLEKTALPDPADCQREASSYAVRHLERFSLGASYHEMFARLHTVFEKPPLRDSTLAVDLTGVGKPVLDLLRKAKVPARLRPMMVAACHKATQDGATWLVPKLELASLLQVLLQSRRIKVSPSLIEAETLVRELGTFQVKPAVDKDKGLDWRQRPHDDLVLACAIAVWQGERNRTTEDGFAPHVIELRAGRGWQTR